MKQSTPQSDWSRIGPGIGIDFSGSPDEIQETIESGLLNDFGPYEWLMFEPIWDGKRLVGQACTIIEINKTSEYLAAKDSTTPMRLSWRLRSRSLHPLESWDEWSSPESFCALNGMPRLSRYRRDPGERAPYEFGMVWKVGNREQTEFIEHDEYRRIFEKLRHKLRKLKKKNDDG